MFPHSLSVWFLFANMIDEKWYVTVVFLFNFLLGNNFNIQGNSVYSIQIHQLLTFCPICFMVLSKHTEVFLTHLRVNCIHHYLLIPKKFSVHFLRVKTFSHNYSTVISFRKFHVNVIVPSNLPPIVQWTQYNILYSISSIHSRITFISYFPLI